jgi:hypothetical protein
VCNPPNSVPIQITPSRSSKSAEMRASDSPLSGPKCSIAVPVQRKRPLPRVPIQSDPSRAGHITHAHASLVCSTNRGTKRVPCNSETGPHWVAAQILPA